MTIVCNPIGGFEVAFREIHDHNSQTDMYMLNFINSIQVCQTIRDMMDTKLYARISKSDKIRQQIHEELLRQRQRKDNKSFFQFRDFNMYISLETHDIKNHRLSLDTDTLVNKNNTLLVQELVQRWKHEFGEESFVRYFKQARLIKNVDTDDEDPNSNFNSHELLIVLQCVF